MKAAGFCRKLLSRRGDNSGQSLVEMALSFSILITFLVGAADLTRVVRASISVTNAAKAGAQYGAQDGSHASDTSGIQAAAAAESPNLTLNTTPTFACVCSDGSTSTCANTDCSNSHTEETVTVISSTTVSPMMRLPGMPSTWTISSKAVQRCLQ